MVRTDIHNRNNWDSWARQSGYRARKLAAELHVSQRQLERYTHLIFQRSPQDWLNEQRLAEALKLLQGPHSIKAVSFELGFRQLSHFSREFKRRYGLCPSRYVLQLNSDRLPSLTRI